MRSELPPRSSPPWAALLALAGLAAGCSYDPLAVGGGYLQGEVTAWRTSGLLVGWQVPVNVHVFTTGTPTNRNLEGRTVVLEYDGDASVPTQPTPTDAGGWTSAAVLAGSAGTVVVHAYVESEGLPRVELTPPLTLEFTDRLGETLVLEEKRFDAGSPMALATGKIVQSYPVDLVVADGTEGAPRLLVVRGSCTFPDQVDELGQDGPGLGVTTSDLDGDGFDEIAIARTTGSITADLGIYDWTSTTGLAAVGAPVPLASPPLGLVAGVFTSGDPRAVVAGEPRLALTAQPGGVEIYFPSTHVTKQVAMPSPPTALAAGRVDADDTDDLVLVSSGVPTVRVLFGADAQRSASLDAGPSPVAAVIEDLNLDGRPDIAVVTAAIDGGANELLVFLQDAPPPGGPTPTVPTFTRETPLALGGVPAAIATGDLNHDDFTDVAVVTQASTGGQLEVFLQHDANSGDPEILVRAAPLPVAANPTSVAVGELTGDGYNDVVVGSVGQPLTIYLGR